MIPAFTEYASWHRSGFRIWRTILRPIRSMKFGLWWCTICNKVCLLFSCMKPHRVPFLCNWPSIVNGIRQGFLWSLLLVLSQSSYIFNWFRLWHFGYSHANDLTVSIGISTKRNISTIHRLPIYYRFRTYSMGRFDRTNEIDDNWDRPCISICPPTSVGALSPPCDFFFLYFNIFQENLP